MKLKRHFQNSLLLLASLGLLYCNGSGPEKPSDAPIDETPALAPSATADLQSLAENTFADNGININPAFIDFGATAHNQALVRTITLNNVTSSAVELSISLHAAHGGFSLIEQDGVFSAFKPLSLKAGESQNITLKFDAGNMGIRSGSLNITARDLDGHIVFPFRAQVNGSPEMKVVSTDFFCANKKAPELNLIDFGRVATNRSRVKSFKICNTGGSAIRLDNLITSSATGHQVSASLSENAFTPFDWNVFDSLNSNFFDYYNPSFNGPVASDRLISYVGPAPNQQEAFGISVHTLNGPVDTNSGVVIPAGEFVRVDVSFDPNLDSEAPRDTRYFAYPYASDLDIRTSLGGITLDLVGSSGGYEPMLEASYVKEGASEPTVIDLRSPDAALDFGKAAIFNDWITENFKEIEITLKNIGSGNKNLEVWTSPINEGYFTFAQQDPEITYPITLAPGEEKNLKLRYAPTPTLNKASTFWDFGQLILHHTGGSQRLTLIGEQEDGQAIRIMGPVNELRQINVDRRGNPKAKNFCAFKKGDGTLIDFVVQNHSTDRENELTTSWSFNNLEGVAVEPASGSITTAAGEESKISIRFTPSQESKIDDKLTGTVHFENVFAKQNQHRAPPKNYIVPFKGFASNTTECTGSAAGQAPDDVAIVIIDRITMNLLSLPEPNRNPPSFKFHLPVDLDRQNKRARIHGLKFDPTVEVSPVNQIRSYAHQITSFRSDCFPLPTNPYKLEFEEGSWDGPYQCDHDSFQLKGSQLCMANNGTQKAIHPVSGQEVDVFYHEFVKFNEDCTPWIEGKFSTTFLNPGEGPIDVIKRMENEVGFDGTVEQYEQVNLPFTFDSYIFFHHDFSKEGCEHAAGTRLETPEEIKACINAFIEIDKTFATRAFGMVNECSYFQFDIEEGCGPDNLNEPHCQNVDLDDPSTWKGYGEYEIDPQDENKYHLTLRNVHIRAFTLVHGLHAFFNHNSKLLFSDIFTTLTTKPIGREDDGTPWDDLIANEVRADFTFEDTHIEPGTINAEGHWTNPLGVTAQLTVGEDDDIACDPIHAPTQCRGNYEYDQGKIVHAGEAMDLEHKNRLLLSGLSSFKGQGQLAPSFARATASKGKPVYFSFHGCMIETERDENGLPIALKDPTVGCYEEKLDDEVFNGKLVRDIYAEKNRGILTSEDLKDDNEESKARINFRILDDDRNRLTDYYNHPNHFEFNDESRVERKCGYGM